MKILRMKRVLFCFALVVVLSKVLFAQDKSRHPAPYPQFSVLHLCVGDTATFINQTSGGVTYKWMLSTVDTVLDVLQKIDSATTTNYSYYFSSPGLYEVTLEADNGHLSTLSRTISINGITKAAFDFQECSNQFVNLSTCASQFFWDFGDSDTSYSALPIHQYQDTGFYTVKLKAWTGSSIDSISTTIHLDVTGAADPTFTLSISNNTVTFGLVNVTVPMGQATWNFGDGSNATGTTVTHVYPTNPDTYFINVFVSNECGVFMADSALVLNAVGIRENANENQVSVFPSPASDKFTIKSNDITGFDLYDLTGRTMISKNEINAVSNMSVDIKELPAGNYILKVRTKAGIMYKKVLISDK